MSPIPRIISVDDHIVEPQTLWLDRLPSQYHDRAPRIERLKGRLALEGGQGMLLVEDPDAPDAQWGDQWRYDDYAWPLTAGYANVGKLRHTEAMTPITYDDMLPGCYDRDERLADMDLNHTDAQLCFPTLPRFCGQAFAEREDKDFALLCLKAFNDFIIDEWGAGPGYGRLIPMTLVPLWDAELAAAEVQRCAAKGSHAITFPDVPPFLGLPSLHSGYWDPLVAACEDTETVINMHIGSSSTLPKTSDDAPLMVTAALSAQYSQNCLVDWLASGVLARFATVKIALSEGQIAWIPYFLERLDNIWHRSDMYEADLRERLPEPPSHYFAGRVYGCIFDDLHGLRNRDVIGMGQIAFETDYPHADSTYPESALVAEKLCAAAGLNEQETYQLVRGTAIECYGLARWGITE
jgi:predicted TIM-barrel fold metal-dependent hydrolase